MTEARSLHHTGLTVADLDRSLAFYRDLLGFEVVLEQEKEGGYLGEIVGQPDAHVRMAHVKLAASDHRIELFQYLRPRGSEPAEPLEPWSIGPTHVCLIVSELPALYERLRAAGVESFLSPPVEVDTGANAGGKALYLRDPDGTLLELFQPAGRMRSGPYTTTATPTGPVGAGSHPARGGTAMNIERLTIRRIETFPIRVPLRRTYRGSGYQMTHRSTIVVRVHMDEGVVGESYAGDEDAGLCQIDRIISRELAPQLEGEDALAVERCWELMRPATYDILRDRRLGLVATACVDAALWDAVGKALGQPLWRLWGGFRSSVPMISIGGYYDTGISIPDEIEELRELGLAGLKFKVGGRTPEEDADRFREARAAAGPDFILAADANQGWAPADAIRFARLVAGQDLAWFEEPCRWANDRRAMRDVRFGAPVRVCAGQSELSAAGCRDLMAEGAIDICNFDASWSGGPTEWRRAAAIAHAYDVRMGHHEEPQVATHLVASVPHGTVCECFHPDRDPIWWNLVANRPALVDGRLELTSAPGLGWELDWDYVEGHLVHFDHSS